MIPKIIYGKKIINVGHVFEAAGWLVHCTHSSEQLLKFSLYKEDKILDLQKTIIPKMRQPWRILKSNFEFKIVGEDKTGIHLHFLFYNIDDYIKPKARYDRSNKD